MDQRIGKKQKYEERKAYNIIIRLMLKDKLEMRKQQQDNMYGDVYVLLAMESNEVIHTF
jgi:hypothetical protein